MTRPVRVAIHGAAGRMGQALCALAARGAGLELVAAVVAPASPKLGSPVPGHDAAGLRFACDWNVAPPADVVVDFSTPAALAAALDHCLDAGVALVTGTTGCDGSLQRRLDAAAGRIAVLQAPNFSLGVAVLAHLLHDAAAALPDWDVEIAEIHHRGKRDAPSGTALALGRAVAAARGGVESSPFAPGRSGPAALRGPGSIGFASLRGGDVVGEHVAYLLGDGERVELAHRATDRAVFARGALRAARWLCGRPPGAWTLDDMLFGTADRPVQP